MLGNLMADPSVLLPFVLIGFAAQLVDGALGMAFGTISSTLLISIGVPPATASAGVHAVETVTTGVSAISHIAHRNVDWKLFFRLVIPGVIGGVLGAYVLTNIDAEIARPAVLAYLMLIGIYLAFAVDSYAIWDGWIIAALVLWAVAGALGQRTGVAYMQGMNKAKELDAAGKTGPDQQLLALNRTQAGVILHSLTSLAVLLILLDMIFKPGA